ncbi:hypothetical protein [Streptomyces sp. AVP053U2]|uniref:hypothetical protein n=1 Tax=Streptomyces sp. AVP053U2 TaxID=1737066 RepID=UPI00114C85CE|nr:hypothetical protein [Streptomyces sp. AVP053U2]
MIEASTSPHPNRPTPLRRSSPQPGQRGGPAPSHQSQLPCWPKALRTVRSWLTPALVLRRRWTAWSTKPPPAEPQELIDAVTTGQGIQLYTPP